MKPEPIVPVGLEAKPPLRVLHLEDNVNDRKLVSAMLASADLPGDFRYATSEAEFQKALDDERFDLILSDFTMPGYDGAAALTLAQARHPEIPFLVVSGTIGEERAIHSLTSGATDYVLKSHLERLVPAVKRALREAAERTKRRQAETALRQSEERFREMADTIQDVFWITSADGSELFYISPAYAEIFGRPVAALRAQRSLWTEAVAASDLARAQVAWARLPAGQAYRVQYEIARPDGVKRWVEDRGYPVRNAAGVVVHAVGIVTDITERRHLEEQLLQSQKMEAIGQLAGGIAHDFNNILTVINGGASLMLDAGKLSPNDERVVKHIYTAGERAARLTRQLLVFSRKQSIHRQPLDLNRTIEEVTKLLVRLIGEDIALTLHLLPGLSAINADAIMVEQVLMNLAVNARDAMPSGGTLTITTNMVQWDETAAAEHASRRAGQFVSLCVRDTGAGIAPEIMPRIFEPFFTTKDVGVGTGLGLATVFGIVKHHEGWIEVHSAPGQGTSFEVFLPATPDAVMAKAPTVHPFSDQRGKETILLVEDETTVRDFAVAVLENTGYRVLQAASGAQALEVWKWHNSRITLLFTDLVMPEGISGVDLARTLQREKPALKLVFTSGYNRLMSTQVFTMKDQIPFIQKPYVPATLKRVIRETLDAVERVTASTA